MMARMSQQQHGTEFGQWAMIAVAWQAGPGPNADVVTSSTGSRQRPAKPVTPSPPPTPRSVPGPCLPRVEQQNYTRQRVPAP